MVGTKMIETLHTFTSGDFTGLMPEIILCAFVLLISIYDFMSKNKDKEIVSYLTQIGLLATLISVLSLIGDTAAGDKAYVAYNGMFVLDNFAIFLKAVVLMVAVMTVAISHKYNKEAGYESGEYYTLIMFAVLGMMIMVSGGDLISIFVGLELMAIPCYFLTGVFKKDSRSIEAALKYFLMGAFSSAVLAYGISFVYGVIGSTNLEAIASFFDLAVIAKAKAGVGMAVTPEIMSAASAELATRLSNPIFYLVLVLFAAGFGFKIAAAPFHMWCPDVYEGAPTPITGFMSTAVKAASFAIFLRVYATGLFALHVNWAFTLGILSALTMTVGNFLAVTQKSVKRMLAYSSIAHAGYIMMGLVSIGIVTFDGVTLSINRIDDGMASVLFYLVTYAFMNLGPFIIIMMLRTKRNSGEMMADFHGLGKRAPILAALMLLFMFGLTGLPPTGGFIAKYYLFYAAVKANFTWLTIVACVNTAVSAFYYFRLGMVMYMYEPKIDEEINASPKAVHAVLYICVLVTLWIGIFPDKFFEAAKHSLMRLKYLL